MSPDYLSCALFGNSQHGAKKKMPVGGHVKMLPYFALPMVPGSWVASRNMKAAVGDLISIAEVNALCLLQNYLCNSSSPFTPAGTWNYYLSHADYTAINVKVCSWV